jgi:hypothetical protein
MSENAPLYAHRLGRDAGPDSSRAALLATLGGPVDSLETDACLTADGRLVLLLTRGCASLQPCTDGRIRPPGGELQQARLRDRHGAVTAETPMLFRGAS